MTVTVVKNAAGEKFVVSNKVKNAAGTEFDVANDVKDSDANPFTIFGTSIETELDEAACRTFDVTSDREFIVTCNRESGDDMVDQFKTDKGINEVLDYIINWDGELEVSDPTDQINTSSWVQDDYFADDLTVDDDSVIAPNKSVVRVSGGGRAGTKHRLVNRVVTLSGQTLQRVITVSMIK